MIQQTSGQICKEQTNRNHTEKMQRLGVVLVVGLFAITASALRAERDVGKSDGDEKELFAEHEKIRKELKTGKEPPSNFRTKYQEKVWRKFIGVKSAKFYTVGSNAREFKNVVISDINPGGIRITHDSGAASIPFEDLPETVQTKLHFLPELAHQYRSAQEKIKADGVALREERMKEAEEAKAEQKIADSEYFRDKEEKDRRTKLIQLESGIRLAESQIRDIESEIRERQQRQRLAQLRGKSGSHTAQVPTLRKKIQTLRTQIARAEVQIMQLRDAE